METGVEDLQFEIKPKSFFYEGKITPYFTLYLEKGIICIIQACKFQADIKAEQNTIQKTRSIALKIHNLEYLD